VFVFIIWLEQLVIIQVQLMFQGEVNKLNLVAVPVHCWEKVEQLNYADMFTD